VYVPGFFSFGLPVDHIHNAMLRRLFAAYKLILAAFDDAKPHFRRPKPLTHKDFD
jgi:hypothetical protein